ncbi:MAG: glycosyltransferase, partial [Gorillibacterium sp.]|nr:glycosyltransferase [Gorillibacterium sp.]
MQPTVTIIIPFYRDPYVGVAIESALAQTYPQVEVLVINDGSPTHNELLYPYLNRIHYIVKANGGTASALNEGIRRASGEYIAWLSSDDMFSPFKVSQQLQFMLERQAEISFTNFDAIDGNGKVTQEMMGQRFPDVIKFYETFLRGNPVNGCTIMAKRDLLLRLGLFDESFIYTHDYELWFRVLMNRIDFHYLDQSLTWYRWHSNMGTNLHRQSVQLECLALQQKYSVPLQGVIHQKMTEQR